MSFISYSYGAEFHLTPKFSIGIDGGAFRRNKTYDDENDVPIDGTFEKRNYMFLDLKYHFVNNTNFSFYGSIVSKQFGKYYSWSEKFDYDFPSNYNFKQYELYQRGEFVEYGAGIGTKLYIANYQAGFDFSFFVMQRKSNYRMMKLVDNEILYSTSNTQQTIPFFRITFFYHFFRFKKKFKSRL